MTRLTGIIHPLPSLQSAADELGMGAHGLRKHVATAKSAHAANTLPWYQIERKKERCDKRDLEIANRFWHNDDVTRVIPDASRVKNKKKGANGEIILHARRIQQRPTVSLYKMFLAR